MSTASKLASELLDAVVIDHSYVGDVDEKRSVAAIDQSLAPVRECLEGLRGQYVLDCFCDAERGDDHKQSCLAAQQLYERLQIQ